MTPQGSYIYTNRFELQLFNTFGFEIKMEAKGNDFKINFAYTENGLIGVQSLSHLAELIGSKVVTGVQIESYKECNSMWDAMRSFGSLD